VNLCGTDYADLKELDLKPSVQLESRVIAWNASVSGVPVASMTVHRNGDGQPILSGGTPPNKP